MPLLKVEIVESQEWSRPPDFARRIADAVGNAFGGRLVT